MSTDVCEMFGTSGIPMIVIVHPDGKILVLKNDCFKL